MSQPEKQVGCSEKSIKTAAQKALEGSNVYLTENGSNSESPHSSTLDKRLKDFFEYLKDIGSDDD